MCTSYDSFLFVAGILLIVASVINGSTENLNGQLFAGTDSVMNIKSVLGVAVLSRFIISVLMSFHRRQRKSMCLQKKLVRC